VSRPAAAREVRETDGQSFGVLAKGARLVLSEHAKDPLQLQVRAARGRGEPAGPSALQERVDVEVQNYFQNLCFSKIPKLFSKLFEESCWKIIFKIILRKISNILFDFKICTHVHTRGTFAELH